jgi:hypothetical protein
MSKLHGIATKALLIVVPVLCIVLETAGGGAPVDPGRKDRRGFK